ncbi:CRPV-371 [Crowpox virus]|nr:CRPV-371 [Crowpox virus]
MLDYITNSLFSHWNQEFHLFLMKDTEVEGIIKDNLVTNLNIINEDNNQLKNLNT